MEVAVAVLVFLVCAFSLPVGAQAWSPDLGNGRYKNPIIFADYSDPDVIRVGDSFFMTASSFGHVPGLPILESRDLVNWRIVNYAIRRLPSSDFDVPQHGNGVWAPSIRQHGGWFYIYYGDPDRGIYVVRTKDVRGTWERPRLVRSAKGWIDPAPLWDDDGQAYLVHAFANSRAGVKSILHVNRMSADGLSLLDDGTLVFDGHAHHPTIEGPKLYKRNGWYYIFAPAGGVSTGWQTVLRSHSVLGPYEDRIVLAQGTTRVNGPHQGAWVELANGDDWFVHFQDRGAYGRVTHLEPMAWRDDWPVVGSDADGNGTGEPVSEHEKPNVGRTYPPSVPQTTDEFNSRALGAAWQWQANPQPTWSSLASRPGWIRLFSQPLADSGRSLWAAPNLLLQKFPAPEFVATTRVSLPQGDTGTVAGLIVFGSSYAYLGVRAARVHDGDSAKSSPSTDDRRERYLEIFEARSSDAANGSPELRESLQIVDAHSVFLRVRIDTGATWHWSYSKDGRVFNDVGSSGLARAGRWVGAKVGVFTTSNSKPPNRGYADFDFFRITEPDDVRDSTNEVRR